MSYYSLNYASLRESERKRSRQPRRPVARPSAYRRRWLSSLLFRSSLREFIPICRLSPTCARLWVRVLFREDRFSANLLPLDSRRGERR
ncbi:unnamed protein product [Brassica oleracea var. botrytis]